MPHKSFLALPLLLVSIGCSNSLTPTPSASAISVTGNWQFVSPTTAKLPSLSGELTGAGASITAILHSNAATACIAPTTAIELRGAADAGNLLTLTGILPDGGALTLTGTIAANGKSLTAATYNVIGGACALPSPAGITSATVFAPITGNYTGTFSDPNGPVIIIAAALTQTPASDTDGNFQLTGNATFGTNPCFSSPVSIAGSQVTGGTFTLTYADPTTLNSVTASGTFTPDGTTLNVTNWTLTGSCGPDQGTGTLTHQ